MPVLSSFISYRPKRKKAPIQVSAPFPVNTKYGSGAIVSPHPYASPRILDKNGVRSPPAPPEKDGNVYFNGKPNGTGTPRVQLNLDLGTEQGEMTDWFPTGFLKSTSEITVGAKGKEESGSGTYYGGYGVQGPSGSGTVEQETREQQGSVEDEEEEVSEESSSAGHVLADLEAMDDPPQPQWRKPAPTPIKIPNAAFHNPKVQLLPSSDASRPTSTISSPESSAVSGTTLARALMANTFVLSGDTRQSRYRSGGSNLTRTDSATLPRGEYGVIYSPYWKDRASMELALSPGAMEDVPPVPGNAELVYVPPQTQREANDSRNKKSPDDAAPEGNSQASFSNADAPAPAPSLSLESLPGTSKKRDASPTPPAPAPSDQNKNKSQSRRYSIRPDMDVASLAHSNTSDGGFSSPPASEPPSSAKDLDNVLDYYSFADSPEPTTERSFRPPFSPITEETSSQLSPPTPFKRDSMDSRRSSRRGTALPPGRFFLGTTPNASTGGARLDWTVRTSTSARTSTSSNISSKPLLPFSSTPPTTTSTPPTVTTTRSTRSRSNASITSIPESVTSTTSTFTSPTALTNPNMLLPPPTSIFNRQRSGSAPAPIKVVRDTRDPHAYNITVTSGLGTSGSAGSNGSGESSGEMQQTFPETPSAFSPGFSPDANGIASPGMRSSSIVGEYLSMPMGDTPMSAFGSGEGRMGGGMGIQPSLAQQVLLTRAATS
ncbi:hypothetical protein DXG01_013174, partial [Tephrocybe rancida]